MAIASIEIKEMIPNLRHSNNNPLHTTTGDVELASGDGVLTQQPVAVAVAGDNDELNNQVLPNSREWSTKVYQCSKDEESCWWGTWCCWILHARTTESFGLGSSLESTVYFWIFLISLILVRIFGGLGLFLLYGCIGASVLTWQRAKLRTAIREKLGIAGSIWGDCFSQCCCTCCAVCQEAREAKSAGVKLLDFCSGQELSDNPHIMAVEGNLNSNRLGPEGGSFFDHLKATSKTSKIILALCAVVCALCLLLLWVAKPQNIVVLLLVFSQPFLVLYVVYWRSRRKYSSLDYVIKIFACGFWFTSFQSIVLESILQSLIGMLLYPFLGPVDLELSDDTVVTDDGHGISLVPSPLHAMIAHSSCRLSIHKVMYRAVAAAINFGSFFVPEESFVNGYSASNSHNVFPSASYSSGFGPMSTVTSNHTHGNSTMSPEEINYLAKKMSIKANIVVVIIGLLLMSFVVAAGVEETMKHFAVRCCRFPTPLRDPHTTLVYLLTSALGFATAENIEYVFGTNSSPIPGTSVFVGELVVLLVRVLLPVHLICATLQAANLSKARKLWQAISPHSNFNQLIIKLI